MVPPSRAERRKFCSHKCRATWMSENLTGENALRYGKGHTLESRKKMSETKKAQRLVGEKSPHWRGGTYYTRGYRMVKIAALSPEDVLLAEPMKCQNSSRGDYIPEHRLVAARMMGRPLTSDEHVHHMNGKKDDNRPENLEVHSASEHRRTHVEVDREVWQLRKENAELKALLSKFYSEIAHPSGISTSR